MKRFVLAAAAAAFAWLGVNPATSLAEGKKILFLAGPRDHGAPGRHEYERDLRTLAQSLEQATNLEKVSTQLIVGSLPRDLGALDGVAAIVIDSSSDRADNRCRCDKGGGVNASLTRIVPE